MPLLSKLSNQEIEILQGWQDGFTRGHQTEIQIMDAEGAAVTCFSDGGCLCDKLQVSKSVRKGCPWLFPPQAIDELGNPLVQCAFGVCCFAMPLISMDTTIGYVVGGRIVCGEAEHNQVRVSMMDKLDVAPESVTEALVQLHVISEEVLRALIRMAQRTATLIAVGLLSEAKLRSERQTLEVQSNRLADLASLLRASRSLTSAADLPQVLRRIVAEAVRVVDADVATLYRYDELLGEFSHPVGVGMRDEKHLRQIPVPSKHGVAARIVRDKELLLAHERDDYSGLFRKFAVREGLYSAIGLPLINDDRAVGVVFLSSRSKGWARTADGQLLQSFAEVAALAIDRANWIEQLSVLHSVGQAINAQLDPANLVREVYDQTRLLLAPDVFTIALCHRGRDTVFLYAIDEGLQVERDEHEPGSITRFVIETKQTLHVADPNQAPLPVDPSVVESGGRPELPLSYIFVPLLLGQNVLGVISIQSYRANAFGGLHKQILSIIASHTAIAVANSRAVSELKQTRGVEQQIVESIAQDPKRVLAQIAEGACKITGADCAVIYPYDAHRTEFYDLDKVAAFGTRHDLWSILTEKPRGKGGMAARVREEGILIVRDLGEYARIREKVEKKESRSFSEREGIEAFVGVSLNVGKGVVGVLYFNFRQPRDFSDEALQTMQVFGNQAAIAIEIARLLELTSERLERKVQELETAARIDRAIINSTTMDDLNSVLGLVVEEALDITQAPSGNLMWVDEQHESLVMRAPHGVVEKRDMILSWEEGITGWVAKHGKSALVGNVRHEPWSEVYVVSTEDTVSELAVPLVQGDKVIGVLNVESQLENAFDTQDQALLEHLAQQALIAIRTVQRYEDAYRARHELEVLAEIDRAISSTLDLDEVLTLILDEGLALVGAPCGNIMLFDEITKELELAVGRGTIPTHERASQRIGEGVVGMAAEAREPCSVPDVTEEPWKDIYIPFIEGIRSELAVPMTYNGILVGVLNAESTDPAAFGEDDTRILQALASRAVLAIQNAELFAESQQAGDRFQVLYQAGKKILNEPLDVTEVLSVPLITGMGRLGAHAAVAWLLDEAGEQLEAVAPIGAAGETELQRIDLEQSCVNSWVARNRRTRVVFDVERPPSDIKYMRGHPDTNSELVVPLMVGDTYLGNLDFGHTAKDAFREDEVKLIEMLADQAAMACQRIRELGDLERTKQREREAQSMDSCGYAAMAIMHKLGNNLGLVKTWAEWVWKEIGRENKVVNVQLERIVRNIQSTLDLQVRLREDLARDSDRPLEKKAIPPSAILRYAWAGYPPPASIKVDIDCPEDISLVWTDERIFEAFCNLFTNAVQVLPNQCGRILLRAREVGSWIEFLVSDDGPGIPSSKLDKVFDLFYTTKPDSLGFGLWSTRRIILGNGGDISVESTEGTGTAFTVRLPCRREKR